MFVDTAKVFISAGKGGDGAVSFRREIYVDKGGPDGGDGGKGGNVVFVASESLNTLLNFRYKPELKADDGGAGSKRNRHGRDGESLQVKVPVGTIVRKEGRVIADLTHSGQEVIVARGGDGGFGNAHFKSSTRQTPRVAEKGDKGDVFEAELELKLLADVGLVGFPNAGKSTFLSVVSNAKPEIADYAFTTLTPNLGVADIDEDSLLIADIPGLIEGASEGKGLGDDFLRHVERTAVLLHMIDAYTEDIAAAYKTIRAELEVYNVNLKDKPEVIALTKTEGLDKDIIKMQTDALRAVAGKKAQILVISSAAHKGLQEVLRALSAKVKEVRATLPEEVEKAEYDLIGLSQDDVAKAWQVEKVKTEESEYFVVTGTRIEKFARKTDFGNYNGVNRLRDIMKKMGIVHELTRQGAGGNSLIRIGTAEFTLLEQ